jgi:hypothetical protein
MPDFLQVVRERVAIFDGAMGTNIQVRQPTLDDFWGKENCSEVLVRRQAGARSSPAILYERQTAFCSRIDRADNQAAFARSHQLRRNGCRL